MYKVRDVLLDNTFGELESFKNITDRDAFLLFSAYWRHGMTKVILVTMS